MSAFIAERIESTLLPFGVSLLHLVLQKRFDGFEPFADQSNFIFILFSQNSARLQRDAMKTSSVKTNLRKLALLSALPFLLMLTSHVALAVRTPHWRVISEHFGFQSAFKLGMSSHPRGYSCSGGCLMWGTRHIDLGLLYCEQNLQGSAPNEMTDEQPALSAAFNELK